MNKENAIEVKMFVNPFVRGDKMELPKGTEFVSMHPDHDGLQSTKRKQSITINHIGDGFVDPYYTGKTPLVGEVIESERVSTRIYPADVTYAGAGGYWKIVHLTEELLRANGRVPEYKVIGYVDKASGSFRKS